MCVHGNKHFTFLVCPFTGVCLVYNMCLCFCFIAGSTCLIRDNAGAISTVLQCMTLTSGSGCIPIVFMLALLLPFPSTNNFLGVSSAVCWQKYAIFSASNLLVMFLSTLKCLQPCVALKCTKKVLSI